jgi:hypothetical protein
MFRTPKELKKLLNVETEAISSSDLIRKPKNKPFKEIQCASQFGLGYEKYVFPCWLRVNPEENSDTDFILKTEKGQFLFQTTLADIPGRKMGNDHKPGPDGKLPVRPYRPERGRIEGPRWIADAVKEKVKKNYSCPKNLNLLVYANFTAHWLDHNAVCSEVARCQSSFMSIWVITNHQICSITSTQELGEIPFFADLYNPDEFLSLS